MTCPSPRDPEISPAPDGGGLGEARPVIGIPLQLQDAPGLPWRLTQNRAYFEAVEGAGGVPLPLPVMGSPQNAPPLLELCDGFLLPGGPDVEPERYGAVVREDCNVGTVSEIDDAELAVLHWALERDLPVLAICRGLQLANVALGGSLWQDLLVEGATTRSHQCGRRKALVHGLTLDPESTLASIVQGSRLDVNSIHHQGIRALAEPLRPVGWSDDGLVEAVELTSARFFVGVQCHPEELAGEHPWAARLFHSLVEAGHRAEEPAGTAATSRPATGQPADGRPRRSGPGACSPSARQG